VVARIASAVALVARSSQSLKLSRWRATNAASAAVFASWATRATRHRWTRPASFNMGSSLPGKMGFTIVMRLPYGIDVTPA
jgi:hypothetical protein